MSARGLRAVLFDWDGTLVNTGEASFRCYEKLFGSYGIRFDRDEFRRTYSPNWHHTYSLLGLREDLWTEADARWLEHYTQEEVVLIEGARAALLRVRAAGLRTGLVTSGDSVRVGRELAALDVAPLLDVVVCAEDIVHRKPHPEALLLALDRLGVEPAHAAYVGDSPEDIQMAQAVGVKAVGIPGSFPNRDALAAARPDVLDVSLAGALDRVLSSLS
ncbi:MAG TPA: HAD-IA family hydrolase [Vicinamibacteria bacterium]|nr:HAD-IA family hydrolase [Vicinamibacteria bacterium]